MKWFLLSLLLFTAACTSRNKKNEEPGYHMQPAGVVQQVNAAERYLIFASTFKFNNGQELQAIRLGKRVGKVRVHRLQSRPLYAADILEGAPQAGDLVE
jgi:hypothetical protein